MVGYTVTESPWDDHARAEAEALWEADQLVCPQCGNLREECSDPDALWYPQRHVCYAERAREAASHMWAKKRDGAPFHSGAEKSWHKERTPQAPFHYRDGVRLWASTHDLSPDDDFI